MPLFLGNKRARSQVTSDGESDDCPTASSSSIIATPSTNVATPTDDRKRKQARYSMPSDSPTNMFRVDNELFYQHLSSGATTLPPPVKSHLQLRLQLKRFKVFRLITVPSNYTFAHMNSLLFFLFGWSGHHSHQFHLVKDVKTYSGKYKSGEIKSSRPWVKLLSDTSLDKTPNLDDLVKVEAESKWTIARVWGSAGVFTERAVIYEYELNSPWSVELTLVKPQASDSATNHHSIIQAKGAPPQENPDVTPLGEFPDEDAEEKEFVQEKFNGKAFEKYLRGELVTFLGETELCVCTKAQASRKAKQQRNETKRACREAICEGDVDELSSDEEVEEPSPDPDISDAEDREEEEEE